MFRNPKVQTLLVLAAGALLGYGVAVGGLRLTWQSEAAPVNTPLPSKLADAAPAPLPDQCPTGRCAEGDAKGILVAQANKPAVAQKAPNGNRPPNILAIMGDDIGWFNIG